MVRARLVHFTFLACAAVGCSDGPVAQRSPGDVIGRGTAPHSAAQVEPAAWALTTLPASGVVVTGKTGAVAFTHDGEEAWRFEAEAGDEIVAAPAVAPDSSVFVLTRRALVAIAADGEVRWTVPSEPAAIPIVLALSDGSVVIMSGSDELLNIFGGAMRWRFRLPDGDTIMSHPRVAGNGHIFVQGTARLYVVDMSGIPAWDQPL